MGNVHVHVVKHSLQWTEHWVRKEEEIKLNINTHR